MSVKILQASIIFRKPNYTLNKDNTFKYFCTIIHAKNNVLISLFTLRKMRAKLAFLVRNFFNFLAQISVGPNKLIRRARTSTCQRHSSSVVGPSIWNGLQLEIRL